MRLVEGRLRLGGEITATTATPADETFFNYTDYERSALRTFRVALSAQWQAADRLALLTEVRSDDVEDLTLAAAYARVRPWLSHPFDIQAGRIPPVFGAFGRRAYQADRPLIGYPLAYQYLTSLRTDAVPASPEDLLRMRGRGWRSSFPVGSPYPGPGVPLISAFRWDTGVQARWAPSGFEAALAVTTGTLASPRVSDDNGGKQVAARLAATPITGLVLGASGATGRWLSRNVPGAARHAQTAFGGDAEYSQGYGMVRAEVVWSRWGLPLVGTAPGDSGVSALAAWIEGRYRVSPRVYVAARADRLGFSHVRSTEAAGRLPWDAPVNRYEIGAGYSLRRDLVVRASVQVNERKGARLDRRTFVASQVSWWF